MATVQVSDYYGPLLPGQYHANEVGLAPGTYDLPSDWSLAQFHAATVESRKAQAIVYPIGSLPGLSGVRTAEQARAFVAANPQPTPPAPVTAPDFSWVPDLKPHTAGRGEEWKPLLIILVLGIGTAWALRGR